MTLRLCHWCNREIEPDQLVIALLPPRPSSQGDAGSLEEQPWHRVCLEFIQGAPD